MNDCNNLEFLKKNAVILHTRTLGLDQFSYWMNLHVELILSYGLRPVITTCMPDFITDTSVVLWDNFANPILVETRDSITVSIWDDIINLLPFRDTIDVLSEHAFDLARFLTSERICLAVIPDAFFVDNSLRFYDWVKLNSEVGVKYAIIRERLNDGFEGHLLKSLGHFKHLPNDSSMRLIFIDKRDAKNKQNGFSIHYKIL